MTQRSIIIYSVVALWCAATAFKAVVVLVQREPYIASWWDAGVFGGGRKLGAGRTIIKLVAMLGVAAVCVLALAQVIVQPMPLYLLLGLGALTGIVEFTAPKPKRGR